MTHVVCWAVRRHFHSVVWCKSFGGSACACCPRTLSCFGITVFFLRVSFAASENKFRLVTCRLVQKETILEVELEGIWVFRGIYTFAGWLWIINRSKQEKTYVLARLLSYAWVYMTVILSDTVYCIVSKWEKETKNVCTSRPAYSRILTSSNSTT